AGNDRPGLAEVHELQPDSLAHPLPCRGAVIQTPSRGGSRMSSLHEMTAPAKLWVAAATVPAVLWVVGLTKPHVREPCERPPRPPGRPRGRGGLRCGLVARAVGPRSRSRAPRGARTARPPCDARRRLGSGVARAAAAARPPARS